MTEERWRGDVRHSAHERAAQQAQLSLNAGDASGAVRQGWLPAPWLLVAAAAALYLLAVWWRKSRAQEGAGVGSEARGQPPARQRQSHEDVRGESKRKGASKAGPQALGVNWLQETLSLPNAAGDGRDAGVAAGAAGGRHAQGEGVAGPASIPVSIPVSRVPGAGAAQHTQHDLKDKIKSTEKELEQMKRENARMKAMVDAVSALGAGASARGGAAAGSTAGSGAAGRGGLAAKAGGATCFNASVLAWAPQGKVGRR